MELGRENKIFFISWPEELSLICITDHRHFKLHHCRQQNMVLLLELAIKWTRLFIAVVNVKTSYFKALCGALN